MMTGYVYSCSERGIYGVTQGDYFILTETELTIIKSGKIVVHIFGKCACIERTVDDGQVVGEIRRRHVASDSHVGSTVRIANRLYADRRGTR